MCLHTYLPFSNLLTYLQIYRSTLLPTYLSTYFPINIPFIDLPSYLHTSFPVYLPTHLPPSLFTYLHTYIHIYIHTYIHICIFQRKLLILNELRYLLSILSNVCVVSFAGFYTVYTRRGLSALQTCITL